MQLHNRLLASVLILVLATVLAGCGGGDGGTTETPGSAERVVSDFYDALNSEDYAAAKALYSPEALGVIEDPTMADDDSFRQWAEGETRHGSVKDVLIITSEEDPLDGSMTVLFDVVYDDDTTTRHTVEVVRISDEWKMGLIG